jgi:hypothetical protein
MTITIQVAIFRYTDKCRLNLITGPHSRNHWDGVSWDGEKLTFSGSSLDEAYASAEVFYNSLDDIDFKRVRARMRYRVGRNGHGWPLTPEQKKDLGIDWTPIKDALKQLAGRDLPYSKD